MRNPLICGRLLDWLQRGVGGGLAFLLLGCGAEPARQIQYAPPGTPAELGLAGYAKVICSAVFVSGRDHREAMINSGYFFLAEEDRKDVSGVHVDQQEMSVSMTLRGEITRKARFYGDQGCVIHPAGHDGIHFQPVEVRSSLPPASEQPWPMGDQMPILPWPEEVGSSKLEAAVEAAFADPAALTAAFLVVYKGQILAERYAPGIDKDTQLESWSMGKSLTAALVGILVGQGHFNLEDPAPVPDWQQEGDGRSKIRIADLMHMSSGLRFIAPHDPDYSPHKGYPDHMYIYTGAIDAFEHSISRPLQFEPNTEGRYRNSDPLTLGYIIRQTVRQQGGEYLTFPQRALFDRIGIRKMVLETDPYGNFLLTGYDYGTARNWARLAMLYLQDGVWQGERILPEGWAEFVSTPAPAWKEPAYGGLFWLNRSRQFNLPSDAYFMAGGGGQRVFIVPSLDMVIVRMGHFRGMGPGMETLNEALQLITESVESPGERGAR